MMAFSGGREDIVERHSHTYPILYLILSKYLSLSLKLYKKALKLSTLSGVGENTIEFFMHLPKSVLFCLSKASSY